VLTFDGPLLEYSELIGSYKQKAEALYLGAIPARPVVVDPRRYKSFLPSNSRFLDEYATFQRIDAAYAFGVDGIKTSRDGLVIANSHEACAAKIFAFMNFRGTENELKQQFCINASGWDYRAAQNYLTQTYSLSKVIPIWYRPFDKRYIYYDQELVFSHRWPKMENMSRPGNLALVCASRLSARGFNHVLPADGVVEMKYASHDTNSRVFPYWIFDVSIAGAGMRPNVAPVPFTTKGSTTPTHDQWDSLNSARLALLNSNQYRERYFSEIKNDFPGIPALANADLIRDLADLGRRLIRAQLLRAEVPSESFAFGGNDETRIIETPRLEGNRLWLSRSAYFVGVATDVFEFELAGYQVCRTWVSAGNKSGIQRKGTRLGVEEIHGFRSVLFAIQETLKIRRLVDEAIERQGGWPGAFQMGSASVTVAETRVPRLHIVADPSEEERNRTCVPLVPLQAAATNLDQEPQFIVDGDWEWVAVDSKRRLRPGMFVAEVVGHSMEPAIPDGSFCLFDSPVEGSRQGKTVLVKLHRALDPESGANYTLTRYESEKVTDGDSWLHARITLRPNNPEFDALVFTEAPEEEFAVVAEFLEVVGIPRNDDFAGLEPADPAPTRGPGPPPRGRSPLTGQQSLLEPAHFQPKSTALPLHGELNSAALVPAETKRGNPLVPAERVPDAPEREELMALIRQLFSSSEPRDRATAIRELANGLGYQRVGSRIRETIDNALRTAVRRGILANHGDGLGLAARTIEDYDRDFLKEQFLASLEGRAWKERDDAIRDFARWLGFRRTGPVIDEMARSLINGLIREGRLEAEGTVIRRSD
jgi:hypothetical protein